jgi:Domain of unknown function (DUF4326)
MPKRIQLQRTRGWRKPEGAAVVSRPTRWGNPFKPGDALGYPFSEVFGPAVRDRAHAVEVFATYARITSGYEFLARRELRGRDLACWCKPGNPCHADVLLAISNEDGTEDEGD